MYDNFHLPCGIKSASRTQSYLDDNDGSWMEFWRIWSSLTSTLTSWMNIICHSWVVSKFSAPYHDYKCIKNTCVFGGRWWFLTRVLEDWVIFGIKFYIINLHCMSFFSFMQIFSSLAWLKMYQEYGHTWRTLMVPDWSWGWFGQPCCIGSSWDTLKNCPESFINI